ncbi:TlpA family protein disulfide reductase [Sphingomonas sp. PAMC 26617]|uniref:TlpA family protein disulfide reductase n=1 Tax=Sphingomonas sp. PAMC 26617 TaxID=1112216 RepID=UPI00028863F3|nr:TlpA disulfide reductase family protein [Sphingomonas sp. PAMC 26617]
MQHRIGAVAVVLALAAPLPAAAPAGEQAPAFTVQLYGGGAVDSRSLAGRVVILNFWASWCAPCKRELTELDAVLAHHGSARVAVFAIDAGTRTEPRLLDRQAAAMRVPVATGITEPYRPRGGAVPTTFVIDPRGRIVTVQAGAFRPGEIARLVDTLLGVSPASDR